MNKLLILIAVFLSIAKVSSAQTEKGNQTLGVNAGFQISNSTTDNSQAASTNIVKYHAFNVGPIYSYFVSNNLELGASLNYSYSTSRATNNNQDPSDDTFKNFGGQLFLNKYVLYQNKIGFRVGPYAGFGRQTQTNAGQMYSNEYKQKTNDYFAGGAFDLVYYPAKNLGITLSIAKITYDHGTTTGGFTEEPEDSKGHSDNLNFNLISNGTSVSVYYVFGGK